jgi:phosphoribosylformylglycinamidine synthase
MKAGIIVFPGSNCDQDIHKALEQSGVQSTLIWHASTSLPQDLDLIVLPGGFSYGDYLRSGAIAARSTIIQEVKKAATAGKYVLGICNGFQILTETGLLPGTLVRNSGLKFICREVNVVVSNNQTAYTNNYQQGQILSLPIAHQDGNYITDQHTLQQLQDDEAIVFRYSDEQGNIDESSCPNGSVYNIAGICNKQRNILGMMPHPERACDPLTGNTDGVGLFRSIIDNFKLK